MRRFSVVNLSKLRVVDADAHGADAFPSSRQV